MFAGVKVVGQTPEEARMQLRAG